MKLAVVFLCLGITCLVDANTGRPKSPKWTEADARNVARDVYNICAQADNLKIGSAKERKAKQQVLIENVLSIVDSLSVSLGCTVDKIISCLGLSPDAIELAKAKKHEELLKTVDVGTLVKSIVVLVEGILADAGYLLQSLVVQVQSALGSGSSLPSILYALHNTIAGVLASVTDTPVGGLLASLSKALGGVLGRLTGGEGGIAGGLTGGLGGIGGVTSSLY